MTTEILMPALSPTMEEGTLAKWLVKEGDTVSAGDILAEIETDKATMEFEAVDEGTIEKILVSEGSEGIKVNSPIAILIDDGEKITETKINNAPKEQKAFAENKTDELPKKKNTIKQRTSSNSSEISPIISSIISSSVIRPNNSPNSSWCC